MTHTIFREWLEKYLVDLLPANEGEPYTAGWCDAIRHVLMDLKCGTFNAPPPPGPGGGLLVNADGLLPCPFCGSQPFLDSNAEAVHCPKRKCPMEAGWTDVKDWNTRTPHAWWVATDQQIQAWADRYDLADDIGDLRCMLEDARTIHLLPPPQAGGGDE